MLDQDSPPSCTSSDHSTVKEELCLQEIWTDRQTYRRTNRAIPIYPQKIAGGKIKNPSTTNLCFKIVVAFPRSFLVGEGGVVLRSRSEWSMTGGRRQHHEERIRPFVPFV